MNLGAYCPLFAGSSSHAISKWCAAQKRPALHAMTPYLVLTACAACGLLVRAQEVALARNLWSARPSMRSADRPQPASQRNARETHRHDELALAKAHTVG